MEYLHTMVRISDIDESLDFYCNTLGLVEMNRMESEKGKFTLIFLATPEDSLKAKETKSPMLELTYNWPDEKGECEEYSGGRNIGHLAYRVDNI